MNILLTCLVFVASVISLYADDVQRPIVVVIPSYNNVHWYEENLKSVFDQEYDNFRVIYIDDCSSDGTGFLVERFVAQHNQGSRVQVVRNVERKRALRNIYEAVHSCADEEIIVLLDGDDRFYHHRVLAYINAMYDNPNVWITYGQFVCSPSRVIGFNAPIPAYIVANNAFRQHNPQPSHLRTFYAKLFKQIEREDLLYNGDFFPMTYDLAIMFPMMEMAGERHAFVPEILYVYNEQNPINDHKVSKDLQRKLDLEIRGRTPYDRLVTLFAA